MNKTIEWEVKKHDAHSNENWWHIQFRNEECIEMVDRCFNAGLDKAIQIIEGDKV